jgi:hypothetical protein
VTTTFPVTAPAGTVATMLDALQLVAVAVVAPNFTVLVPCAAPKFAPPMVTDAPTNPDVGLKLVMLAGNGFPPPPGFAPGLPLQLTVAMATTKISIHRAARLRLRGSSSFQHKYVRSGIQIVAVLQGKSPLARVSRLRECPDTDLGSTDR